MGKGRESVTGYEDVYCTQSVDRKIPGHVQVIRWMLYAAVFFFTVIGAMQGFVWLIPALGTLFGSWYYMGVARVTYDYKLEGARLTVTRTSGLQSRRKTVSFGDFDLTTLRVMAPEGSPQLERAEADSLAIQRKRIVYDVSAHDPDDICSVMYLTGVGEEEGRPLKVLFQPNPEMRACIGKVAPGRVLGYGE